jgi:hypothetical protein
MRTSRSLIQGIRTRRLGSIGLEADHYKEKVQKPKPEAERGPLWIDYRLAMPCYQTSFGWGVFERPFSIAIFRRRSTPIHTGSGAPVKKGQEPFFGQPPSRRVEVRSRRLAVC